MNILMKALQQFNLDQEEVRTCDVTPLKAYPYIRMNDLEKGEVWRYAKDENAVKE